ncbi:MAG: hypothetical protein ABSF84_04990 [Acidimicrobiales bacterium]
MSDTGQDNGDDLFRSRTDGQLHFEPGTAANTFPVTAPEDATPLMEDEPEGTIPPSPLWSMKERAHGGIHLFGHPARIRARAGRGDGTVYAIDDGPHHCMIGRRVGATGDGCTYSLVGRVDLPTWQAFQSGAIDGRQIFLSAHDLGLSGTVETTGVSNVFDVDWYDTPDDVPEEYLPPAPFISFAKDLPTADR